MEANTIPGFNYQGGSQANPMIESYRAHRYFLSSIGPLNGFAAYVKKCGRPTMEIDKIVMHHGQDEINLPGKQRWTALEMTFYDVDGVSAALHSWQAQKAVIIASSLIGSGASYKLDCTLDMLDGQGSTLYTYTIYGMWPSKVSPSTISYTDTEIAEVTATFEMDKVDQV